ncbi:hypothetical protein AMTRI_Chr12g236240 [Amborella trichopoda]
MASYHVNVPLLEALAERLNYQTNTFFLPIGETTSTLEEVVKLSSLNLAGIAYQPSTAIDDHSIMGTIVGGCLFFSWSIVCSSLIPLVHAFWERAGYTIVPTVLAGIYRGLHDTIWAYKHITIVRPPRSTTTISAAMGLTYVNDTTRPWDVNYYRRILDELSPFDWVIRGLENVSLLLPAMGHSCLIMVGKDFTEGYFPQRVLRQFCHTQNYTSTGEAIDRCPIFPLQQHSFTLLVKAGLSWKGKKTSSSKGLVKQDKPTTTSNYDFWWERAFPLSLCPRSSRLRGEFSAPGQDLVAHREDGSSCSNKRIKSNEDMSDISLDEVEVELARWAAFVGKLKEKDVDPKPKTE